MKSSAARQLANPTRCSILNLADPVMDCSNPFSVRFVQPGALPWVAPGPELEVAELRRRLLSECNARGAIIGPHGAGKSTLLHHLIDEEMGNCVRLQMRRHAQPWRQIRGILPALGRGQLLVLDGFEQLSPLARMGVRWSTWRRGSGLLVTSHGPCGLPVLARIAPTPALVWRLVRTRLRAARVVLPEDAMDALQQHAYALLRVHRGNVREVFMDLYDWFERFAAQTRSVV
ncbi:MAG: hypothetical protein D6753_09620 [Planctomycetota bacterium]|nr:MAG: hypothetical protein D6753_09620 [Planctomycetota bacterium]